MNARRACLAILVALGALSAQAANTIDPHSTGATDVLEEASGTLTTLTNPLADPFDLGSAFLVVGDTAIGGLLVDNGSSVSNFRTYIGRQAGSVGVVSIEGADSNWTDEYGLYIGESGSGTLNVMGGATVETAINTGTGVWMGIEPGSVGALNVAGAESTLLTPRSLFVGDEGDATLQITGGAAVSNSHGSLAFGAGSTAVVTVDGEGSTWTNSAGLTVGSQGTATLFISNGGHVTAGPTRVGSQVGVGTIEFDDGTLSARTLYVSPDQLQGTGTIHANSLVSDIDLVFDATHGFEQTFEFTELPDQNITLHLDADPLRIWGAGYRGTGTLHVADGVAIGGGEGYLGYLAGSAGVATIDGHGSAWNVGNHLFVGANGAGELHVSGGATVTAAHSGISIASHREASGVVTVEGAGSALSSDNVLYVGEGGEGELHVSKGALVTSGAGHIGHRSGSEGAATVDGLGSTWTSQSLYVGSKGSGSLQVTDGGKIVCEICTIESFDPVPAEAIVDGPGSVLSADQSLTVAYNGAGVLTISAGGLVKVRNRLVVDNDQDGDGFIRLSTGGVLAMMGDSEGSVAEKFEYLIARNVMQYWEESLHDWASLSLATVGEDYSIEYITTGELAGYTLLTVGQLPALAGDYNGDGIVSMADYTVWRNNLGGDAGTAFAEGSRAADVEGSIGHDDYLAWKSNFGARVSALPVPTAVVAVPEPRAACLLLVAIYLMRFVSRRASVGR